MMIIITLLCIICILLGVLVFKSGKDRELSADTRARFEAGLKNDDKGWQPIRELVEIIKEDRAEDERALRDEYLRRLAESKKVIPPTRPYSTTEANTDRLETTNPEGKNILIPEGLSAEERAILKSFYNL